MKRWSTGVTVVLVAVLFMPVLLRQLWPTESRQLERVALSDTRFEEITFHNHSQNLKMGGLLFAPEGEGPFLAAVIIHGSGTSHRDNGWYLTLTKHLQDNGVLVLLPDKRGSEKSAGDWRTSSFQDLATDTHAAIDYLRTQQSDAISGFGVIGMSQGGWIAPLVASQEDELSFVVSMVGAMVTPGEQLLFEENHNLRQLGFLPGVSNLLSYFGYFNVRYLVQPEIYDLTVDYDPLPYWDRVSVPSLVLFGEEDTNVPSTESARRLENLGNPLVRIKMYEGSGHALASPPGQGNRIIREDALDDILSLIKGSGTDSR